MAVAAKPKKVPHSNWSEWLYVISWISDDYVLWVLFDSLSNVWIDWLLMPSRDVNTQKPGSDFDWLIVQAITKLCIIMRNFSRTVVWYSTDRMPGILLVWSWKISTIFIANSKTALVFKTDELINWTTNEESLQRVERFFI